jgi:hypothetical protein
MAKNPKVGDIFEMTLSDGKRAFGQYLHSSKMGPIVQIFDLLSDENVPLEKIISSDLLFPPVITGLLGAVREGYWKIVGYKPIVNFIHPKFVSTLYDEESGKARTWYLWDGQREVKIGPILPEEYKKLEFLVVWNPSNVVKRIETGEIPFPYGELIKNNKFAPLV